MIWRESKYTLIRLEQKYRIRKTTLCKIMKDLNITHGIKGTEIFGFDAVSCNSPTHDESILTHPGFQYMVETMNKDLSGIESWMKEGDIANNRKGLLWKFLKNTDPEKMTRLQLVQRVKEWGPVIKEHEELKHVHSILMAQYAETEREHLLAISRYEAERSLNEEFMQQLKEKIRECGELQRQLIRLRPLSAE